jgi:hypothetical protein
MFLSRSDRDVLATLARRGLAPVSADQGLTLSQQAGCMLYVETRCLCHKHFTLITYGCSKISWCILKMLHGSMSALNYGTTYFAKAVNYERKMFMKFATARKRMRGTYLINLFLHYH